MRHRHRGNRLNRPADSRRALLRNMVTSLFSEERITTTDTKAREARRYAEKMITFAKRGDLNSRRQAARFVNDPKVLQKLFAEIGPRYADRPGGYTRIMKLGKRRGDDAMTAILELVEPDFKARPKREKTPLRARDTEPVVEEALAPAGESEAEVEDAPADASAEEAPAEEAAPEAEETPAEKEAPPETEED